MKGAYILLVRFVYDPNFFGFFWVTQSCLGCSGKRGSPVCVVLRSQLGGFCGRDSLWDKDVRAPFLRPPKVEPREAYIALIVNGVRNPVSMFACIT